MGVTKSGLVRFRCSSATTPGKFWHQYIRFLDFEDALELQKMGKDLTDQDIINLVMAGNLGVYCNDPSFLYYGWKYMAWAKGYGLRPENRPPKVRNPQETGSICKHLLSLFRVMPFYMNMIVADFRKLGLLDNLKKGKGSEVTQGVRKRRKSFQPAAPERIRKPFKGIPDKQK